MLQVKIRQKLNGENECNSLLQRVRIAGFWVMFSESVSTYDQKDF